MTRPPRSKGRPAQVQASNPKVSVFVDANAGSGKTSTLVTRVARLLLAGAPPETILCVTFTKAGAAEMQTRLYKQLGAWAVMESPDLEKALAAIEEDGRDLNAARALFARALETPGGLKIQTIHAFCEKLLRRFPLEAGISPAFTVLDDAAAIEVATRAREGLAKYVLDHPDGEVAAAYGHFSIELDYQSFNDMFSDFTAKRAAIGVYVSRTRAGLTMDVWRRFDFSAPADPEEIGRQALKRVGTARWRRAAEALAASDKVSDRGQAEAMRAAERSGDFADVKAVFLTGKGTPKARLATSAISQDIRDWMVEEQRHCVASAERIASARTARETVQALTLARAYIALYDATKDGRLDFLDLIERTLALLTGRLDAAWVLYKLDSGLRHVLLDEAQDTAPDQWDILRTLTAEFFHGEGAGPKDRTMFAVGDEKQSIFSFQGAAPERLAQEMRAFSEMARAAGARFEHVPLRESWRSAREILEFVDQVFVDDEARAGLRTTGENVKSTPLRHDFRREDHGCVELWPLEQGERDEEEEDHWAPLDREPKHGANRRLAARIAAGVVQMVARGDAVADRHDRKPRPCRHGDVMILVRRRGPLFHEIIRALKREGAPVAGADRLKLAEHGLYEDLMALGRFARFPYDDLSLAVLLRSPFCDVDEEGLFDLAYGRTASLWGTLMVRADERSEWSAASRFLAWAAEEAERRPPFDFYCAVLTRLDPAGRSMRQRILTRLGAEGEQALEAFVGQALAAEASGVRDLETWLAWMSGLELDIKREQQEGGGAEVRVMTVHGAKGLEAPIVILPDTTTRATWQGGRLMVCEDGGFLWAPRKDDDCPASAATRAARETGVNHESARLLYVALTRARDRLIIAGVDTQEARKKNSWRDFIERAFAGLPTHTFALEGGGEGLRYGPDPAAAPAEATASPAGATLPAWALGLAPTERPGPRLASPSRLDEEELGSAPSPLARTGGLGRYRRGEIIHRLLQLLPDLGPEARATGARRLLSRELGLSDDQREEMAGAALAVLADARFAAVFRPGSRAEVPIAGTAASLPQGLTFSGRLDRLLVEPNRVLVADFKTNRPAPARIEDTDPGYIRQMAIYTAILAEVFPDRRIEAALVWTDGPRLMPVPSSMLEAAIMALRR